MTQKRHKYEEGSYPRRDVDVDVLAYNKKWIDPDDNPRGIRIGFRDEDRFYSIQWDNDGNYYYKEDELPEYWTEIPELNL